MLGANSLQRKITNAVVAGVATVALTAACLPVNVAQATPAQLKDSSNVSIEQAAQRLAELSSQTESAALDLGSIDDQIATTKQQIDETQQLLESTQQDLESAKKALAATVSETYRNGSVSYLEVLLGSTSFDDFSSRLSMLDRVAHNRASAIETVNTLQQQLTDQQNTLNQKLSEQESLKEQQQQRTQTIDTSVNAAQTLVENLDRNTLQAVSERAEQIQESQPASGRGGFDDDNAVTRTVSNATAAQGGSHSSSSSSSQSGSSSNAGSGSSLGSGSSSSSSSSSSSAEQGSTSTSGAHGSVVGIAEQYLGVPYVWGGDTPAGFDCSGLVQYCYRKIGIDVGRTTWDQMGCGTRIAVSALQPGDLVFFRGGEHVGIYVGGGTYIHAPYTGAVVRYGSLSSRSVYLAVRP